MLISLLLFSSATILFVVADALLPSALLSASYSSLTLQTLSSDHFNNYDFRYSLIDIPLISIIRSFIIFCVYSFCDGPTLSRGPYFGIATMCSVASLVFVSLKGSYALLLMNNKKYSRGGYVKAMEVALFVGHVVAAYRTSCRERRKLLIYKIDIESEAACKNGYLRYQKILQQGRAK